VLSIFSNSVVGAQAAKHDPSTDWQAVPANGVITKPGRYCLQDDLKTDRTTGIKVEANDVTIDLCGHALRYTGTPKEGSFGITASNRSAVTVCNGTIGGFWFNMHFPQVNRIRVHDIHFDNIPYIGINLAKSTDVVIVDNVFDNFRYDLKKEKPNTYLVGINIGAEGALIANNRFTSQLKPGAAKNVDVETVYILFSAEITKDCLVTRNEMAASDVLPRSYGVWIAKNAQANVVNNTIRNLKYGVCVAGDGSAMVCFNRFNVAAERTDPVETIGISAAGAKDIVEIRNTFDGVTTSATVPKKSQSDHVSGG
jgi:hypothetical protein